MNVNEQSLFDDLAKKRQALIAFMKEHMSVDWGNQNVPHVPTPPNLNLEQWQQWARLMAELQEAEIAYHDLLRLRFDEIGKEVSGLIEESTAD